MRKLLPQFFSKTKHFVSKNPTNNYFLIFLFKIRFLNRLTIDQEMR